MATEIRMLRPDEAGVLAQVAEGVFDQAVDAKLAEEFVRDGRHHMAVAVADGVVVGFASAVHYVHPDKPPELWVNEVAVAEGHRERGLGKKLLAALFEAGRAADCGEAWVLTDRPNVAAMRLYASMGGTASEHVMFNFKLAEKGGPGRGASGKSGK